MSSRCALFRRRVRWEIRLVFESDKLCTATECIKFNATTQKNSLHLPRGREGGRSFVIYRHEVLRLLQATMPLRDKLCFELPGLMAFRTEEMATWRVEWLHPEVDECLVLDAKKHHLCSVPLNRLVCRHVEEYINGCSSGLVIRNESTACRGRTTPLTNKAFLDIYHKWARTLQLYPSPDEYSPVVLRRFFAAEWYYHQGLSLVTLSRIMRHADVKVTLRYVSKLVFDEDVKRDYDKFCENIMTDLPIQKVKA